MVKKSKIEYLADTLQDNTLISPEQCLLNMLDDLRDGRIECDKLLILYKKEGGDTSYYAANIRCSEMLTLLSRMEYAVNKMIDG